MSETTNREIVEAAYAGITSGDVAAFVGALDDSFELHEPPFLPYGGTYPKADLMTFFGKAAAAVAPGGMKVRSVIGEGDQVVALLTLALQNGNEALVSEHWTMRDGKAIEAKVFWFDPSAIDAA